MLFYCSYSLFKHINIDVGKEITQECRSGETELLKFSEFLGRNASESNDRHFYSPVGKRLSKLVG